MKETQIASVALRRSVGLTGLVLYGLGVTIGAGIYVLVGETVLRAGAHAPASFLLSAVVMGFTALSFAELSGRVPQAAGEAVYVERAFALPWLTVATGLAILVEAMIAAAAIALGAAGYLGQLVALPQAALVTLVVLAMTAIAAWGIRESIAVAGAMTVVEVIGLLAIIGFGLSDPRVSLADLPAALAAPPEVWPGVLGASIIAFFAFIGFDDVVNLVEETRAPSRIMPAAIGITLAVVTLLYVLVAFVAAEALPAEAFADSGAPISLLFESLTGLPPLAITLIAIVATLNGVVIILVMASRVAYGMARERRLPAWFGEVSPLTRTPLRATLVTAAIVLGLALLAPLDTLAQTSSQVLLAVFTMVNIALVRIKLSGAPVQAGGFETALVFPVAGALCCLALLVGATLAAP